MLLKMENNKVKYVLIFGLLAVLIAIRAFEKSLFYDPFLVYFKNDYLNLAFPKFDGLLLFLSMSFRYFLNTTISLLIIYVLFRDLKLTKFAAYLYVVFYFFLILLFFSILYFLDNNNNFLLFYLRRFLIQPLFLLLFVPAFYYQKRVS